MYVCFDYPIKTKGEKYHRIIQTHKSKMLIQRQSKKEKDQLVHKQNIIKRMTEQHEPLG